MCVTDGSQAVSPADSCGGPCARTPGDTVVVSPQPSPVDQRSPRSAPPVGHRRAERPIPSVLGRVREHLSLPAHLDRRPPTGRRSCPRTAHRRCQLLGALCRGGHPKALPQTGPPPTQPRTRRVHSATVRSSKGGTFKSPSPFFLATPSRASFFFHLSSFLVIETNRSFGGFPSFSFVLVQ